MQDTNLVLTAGEREAMSNTGFFETKIRVMHKINGLLGHLLQTLEARRERWKNLLPEGVMDQQGKISRGENYRGFPYLVLDYPRNFEKQNVFAFRSMFWWGNFFSYTIQISGRYLEAVPASLPDLLPLLQTEQVWICINKNPWEHHFGATNFKPAAGCSRQEWDEIIQRGFIKLAFTFELSHWDRISENGRMAFDYFAGVLFEPG